MVFYGTKLAGEMYFSSCCVTVTFILGILLYANVMLFSLGTSGIYQGANGLANSAGFSTVHQVRPQQLSGLFLAFI